MAYKNPYDAKVAHAAMVTAEDGQKSWRKFLNVMCVVPIATR